MLVKSKGRTKILVLSVSAGVGHVRAAQAFEATIGRWYKAIDVVHVDLMELVPAIFRKVYASPLSNAHSKRLSIQAFSASTERRLRPSDQETC
jgi:hypothetical protein